MPTTFRLLAIIATVAMSIYATLYALANWLGPTPQETIIIVPPEKRLP